MEHNRMYFEGNTTYA